MTTCGRCQSNVSRQSVYYPSYLPTSLYVPNARRQHPSSIPTSVSKLRSGPWPAGSPSLIMHVVHKSFSSPRRRQSLPDPVWPPSSQRLDAYPFPVPMPRLPINLTSSACRESASRIRSAYRSLFSSSAADPGP